MAEKKTFKLIQNGHDVTVAYDAKVGPKGKVTIIKKGAEPEPKLVYDPTAQKEPETLKTKEAPAEEKTKEAPTGEKPKTDKKEPAKKKPKTKKPPEKKERRFEFPVSARINDYGFLNFRKRLLDALGWTKGQKLTIQKNEDGSITLRKA